MSMDIRNTYILHRKYLKTLDMKWRTLIFLPFQKKLQKKNLISYLKERIGKGLIYIGESAGSVIIAPNIEYVSVMDNKILAEELDDYTGLNLVDFYIVPHFEEEPFIESSRKIVELYKDKLDLKLINNKEIILVENDDFKIIK